MGEIRELEQTILTRCGRPGAHARTLPADLETRRHALLASHLGFTPAAPLPVIHVIGDSHSAFFAGTEGIVFHPGRRVFTGFFRARYVSAFTELLPIFRVFHLGPATAWQAAEPGSSTSTLQKTRALLRCGDVPRGATVLLVFGEIDCRYHIPRAVLGGKAVADAVTTTVDRFLRLADHIRSAGRDPTLWLPTIAPILPPSEKPEETPLPALGPQSLRDEITIRYCEELARASSAAGLRCAGLSAPPLGTPPPADWFWDGNHLSQRVMPAALRALRESGILALAPAPAPA
jgi:hypothetical protein